MLDAAVERLLIAVEIEDAAGVAVVVDRLVGDDLVEHLLRIRGEPVLEQGVAARLGGGAFLKETPGPGVEPRIGREPESQRLVFEHERPGEDNRRTRRGPDEGMAWRDHAGVAPARAGSNLRVAFDDHDLVAVPLQLKGGRDADHAAAEHHYAHGSQSTMAGANRQSGAQGSRHRGRDGHRSGTPALRMPSRMDSSWARYVGSS